MNVQGNARASAATLNATSIPVLRASTYGDLQIRMLALYAGYPDHAPTIVRELEQKGRYYRLDRTLRSILRTAKATVARGTHPAMQ